MVVSNEALEAAFRFRFRFPTAELPPNVKKKKSASFKYKLTKVPQPIKLVVRITLLVTFLKQLSEFYFLSN